MTYDYDNVLVGSQIGYIDVSGEVVIKPRYEDGKKFKDGLAPIKMAGRWGYINKQGDFIVEPKYEEADIFFDKRAMVKLIGKGDLLMKEVIL